MDQLALLGKDQLALLGKDQLALLPQASVPLQRRKDHLVTGLAQIVDGDIQIHERGVLLQRCSDRLATGLAEPVDGKWKAASLCSSPAPQRWPCQRPRRACCCRYPARSPWCSSPALQ